MYWIDAEVASRAAVAAHMCPLEEIDLEIAPAVGQDQLPDEPARKVRSKNLPGEPTPEELHQHELTHLPPRSWCKWCVSGFGIEDAHRRRHREPGALPEVHLDYMFLGRRGEPGLVSVAHAVDVDFQYRLAVHTDKGPVDYVISAICDFLTEIGRTRVILRTDGEPEVKALAEALVTYREDRETVLEHTSKANSQGIGSVERGNITVGSGPDSSRQRRAQT